MRVVVANLIGSGYVPLWNPYMFSGMPLFGAAQAGVLFPLNWFYLIFSSPVATNLMMLSTYMVAALGAYLYARRSGASIAGAAATSLVWQWSAFMVAKVGQTNVVQTAALLPWVLWAVDRYGMTGKRSHGVVLALLVARTDIRRASTNFRIFLSVGGRLRHRDGANLGSPGAPILFAGSGFIINRSNPGCGADSAYRRALAQQPARNCVL